MQLRTYKSEFNIEWVPPPKLKCTDPSMTGDRSPLPEVDLSRATLHAANVEELKCFSSDVKKLMSLEFAPKSKHTQVIKNDIIRGVQRHALDYSSMEAAIAALTIRIRNGQKFMFKHKKDVFYNHRLKEAVEKRKKLLLNLRKMDYKKFEWVLEKLDLIYQSIPNPNSRITRKGSLQRLTSHYCNSIRENRLAAYKKDLEEQKVAFAKEKEVLIRWIEKEEIELGLRK